MLQVQVHMLWNVSKHNKHSHYFSLLLEWEIPFSKNKQYVYLAHKEKKTLNYFEIDILEPLYITQIHEWILSYKNPCLNVDYWVFVYKHYGFSSETKTMHQCVNVNI